MGERPSYRCYLAHCFNPLRIHRLIECKADGQKSYFRDVTKRGRRIVFSILAFLIPLSLYLTPALYMFFQRDTWYLHDYGILALILAFPLTALSFSLGYRFSTFQRISAEDAATIRTEQEKKQYFSRKGSVTANIVLWSFLLLLNFMQSFSASYIRYSIDIAANNQANWPRASAIIHLGPESMSLGKDVSIAKGYVPLTADTVRVEIEVSNSPYEPSILLNGADIAQFKAGYDYRYHDVFFDPYFKYDYKYEIPASLIKPVNTLHVESGPAKRDWTIEITDKP